MRSINKVKLFIAFILALQSDAIIRPSDACGVFEATCPDKSCIAKNLLCNGFEDCSDGSDEINCMDDVCPNGFFVKETHECISCFCSNVTKECSNANLYKYRLQPSFDSYELIAVKKDAHKAVFHITNERNYKSPQLQLTPASRGVHAQSELEVLPYLAMPQNLLGNQLQSYGGYLKYRLNISKYKTAGKTLFFPDLILMGGKITLLHFGDSLHSLQPKIAEEISIGLIEGKWLKQGEQGQNRLATREEIMMALTSVQHILIKMQYIDGFLDTTIDDINMDSASQISDFKDLGRTSYVEECRCPYGHRGLSCQDCARFFFRYSLLGKCEKFKLTPRKLEIP